MDTTKIQEALAELQAEKRAIDQAILSLQTALSALSGGSEQQPLPVSPEPRNLVEIHRRTRAGKSHVDYAIEALSIAKEMHIEALIKKVGEMAGHPVSRASLDGAICREIREKGTLSRFRRTAPAVYALNQQRPEPGPQVAEG